METLKNWENWKNWIEKQTNENIRYSIDEESLRITFPFNLEEKILNHINGILIDIPHVIGHNVWRDVTVWIFLNNYKLKPEKINELLSALENLDIKTQK